MEEETNRFFVLFCFVFKEENIFLHKMFVSHNWLALLNKL